MTDRVYTIEINKSHLDVIFDALLDKTARVVIPIMNNIQVQMAEQAREAINGDSR